MKLKTVNQEPGSKMLNEIQNKSIPEREKIFLDIIKNDISRVQFLWKELIIKDKNHSGKFFVLNDSLKIDGVRINVSAFCEQQIADLFRASLLTAKLADLIWVNAVRITPCTQQISSSVEAMIKHSQNVDRKIGKNNEGKLISTTGKHWILDNRLLPPKIPNQAINYGWHFEGSNFQGIKGNVNQSLQKDPKTGAYYRLIQPASFHHNFLHLDYSQTCTLVSRQCFIDGQEKDLHDIFLDPELSSLVNHDGILRILRQPNVPELDPIMDLPVKQEHFPRPSLVPEILGEPETPDIPIFDVTEMPTEPSPPFIEESDFVEESKGGFMVFIMNLIKFILAFFGRK